MEWSAVAMITFSCVAANHLGMIAAVEDVIRHPLPIIHCPKCFSFWSIVAYGVFSHESLIVTVATAFLMAFLSLWINLLFGFLDYLYNKVYDTLYPTENTDSDGTEHP